MNYSTTTNVWPATISGNVALGTATDTFTVNHSTAMSTAAQTAPDMIVSANISGGAGIGLTKAGAGVLLLSGSNSYAGTTTISAGTLFIIGNNATTGPTTISAGTLIARNAGALGGSGNTSAASVTAGQNFTYYPTTDSPLAIGGNLTINGGGTVIGGAIGSTTTSSEINVAGNAAVTPGAAQKINVYGLTGISPAAGPTSYTLIAGGAGSTLNGGTAPVLNLVYNNTNFTVGTPAVTATALTVPVSSATALSTALWQGGLTGAPNVWAASNGASQSNWVASYGGASQPLVPGPTTNVVFSNNSGAGVTSPNASTLGADMSVNGITLSDTSNSLVLNADGYTITLGAGGINMPNLPAATNLNQNEVIYPNIVLGAAQTWMNNNLNGNAITFYGNVANGGNLLTVDNSGNSVSIVDAVSGGGGLTKYGAQNLAIQGANSYSGATSVFRGGLTISGASGTIDQTSAITIGNNAGITLTNTSAADSLVNRLGIAPVSVYGGYLQFNNTAAANVNYAQTIGAVTVNAGEFDVTLNNSSNNNGVNSSQVLTLAGLTQNGAAAATFSVPTTEPNATNNVIQVSGAAQTAASQIIGPWATVGAATGSQYDYAVYDASGHILPAQIPATAENTWVNGTNVSLSTWPTITSTHALNSLRITADNGTLGLAQFNLQTNGILFADATGNNAKNIGSTSGALMQEGTSPGNLYIAAGQGTGLITISANTQNNTGALTLVKDGSSGSLLLSGLNSFTGGVVSNAGDIEMGATNSVFSTALGSGALVMNGGGIDSNTANMFNLNNNALIINGDFSTTATQSLYFGTGGVTLGTTPGLSRAITVSSTFTLGGVIGNGSYANSLIKAGGGNLVLDGASTYSGTTRLDAGLLEMGVSPVGAVGSITSSAIGSGTLLFNGGGLSSASIAPVTVLNPVGFTGNATIGDPTKLGASRSAVRSISARPFAP